MTNTPSHHPYNLSFLPSHKMRIMINTHSHIPLQFFLPCFIENVNHDQHCISPTLSFFPSSLYTVRIMTNTPSHNPHHSHKNIFHFVVINSVMPYQFSISHHVYTHSLDDRLDCCMTFDPTTHSQSFLLMLPISLAIGGNVI